MEVKKRKKKVSGAEKLSSVIALLYCLVFPGHSAGKGNPY